ncbi:glycosyltransferase [Roseimicrobium sp. ORNL1]|uniref:glycosyltransferase n=1 Tax=Roseimicrobium sp. ORNL1 TaxID=2711231 RepID=UPI0013E10DDC|nr:glycosyltransferase [Roseimicrobium sp. ORNL1]QIF02943.1 glycosyltransferase [Roseimicrobium sp. ORNL1]
MNLPPVSAYLLAFNNTCETLRAAVQSLLEQSHKPEEILVIDDGSALPVADCLKDLPVRVLRHAHNKGRGAARATAMAEAKFDLVTCCDATNALDSDFVRRAAMRLDEEKAAAVFGRFVQPKQNTATLRWRGRHLYRVDIPYEFSRQARLSTHGAMLKKRVVSEVGGFDPAFRYNEDGDLGRRLVAAGYDVLFDPELKVVSLTDNSVLQLLERYWRWNSGLVGRLTFGDYLKLTVYSLTVMARNDLRARDPAAALISAFCPHYQAWKSWSGKRSQQGVVG